MNGKIRFAAAAWLWWAVASGSAWGQQYVDLRPGLAAGEETYFLHEMSLRSVMRRADVMQGSLSAVDSEIGYRLRVLDGGQPDNQPLELTFLVLAHRFGGQLDLSYDSRVDKEPTAPHARMAQALLNRPFRVVVRGDGSVASISGLEDVLKEHSQGVHRAAQEHYQALLQPEAIEQLLLLNLLKDVPAEILVGGTWSSRFLRPLAGGTVQMVRDVKFVLDQVKLVGLRPVATVSMSGDISLGDAPTSHPADYPLWIYKLEGTENGTLYIDVAKRAFNQVECRQQTKQYVRWRRPEARMGVQRIVDQLTSISLRRTTLAELRRPPARTPPVATQPAGEPATTQPAVPQSPPPAPATQLTGADG
ncbi:MAG: hypothetical protein JSU68_00625 [Phycisphaerales bacterium]|nr:MAG: hypothetical protein JSU68_00625 [Phycisphaerales bacterium]